MKKPAYSTRVHMNAEKTLAIQTFFFDKDTFGVDTMAGGSCLIAQFAYSIQALTDIDAQRIVDHVDTNLTREVGMLGHTIEELIEAASVPFAYRGRVVQLELQARRLMTHKRVANKIVSGQPVMLIVDSDASATMCNEAVSYNDGIVEATAIRKGGKGEKARYHAFVACGIDSAGYLILRESRHQYGFKGFLKLHIDCFKRYFRNMAAVAIEVTANPYIWTKPEFEPDDPMEVTLQPDPVPMEVSYA